MKEKAGAIAIDPKHYFPENFGLGGSALSLAILPDYIVAC